MSVKKAAKSAVTDIKSKAIGKSTSIGCMGFMPDHKFGSTVFVYENEATFRLRASGVLLELDTTVSSNRYVNQHHQAVATFFFDVVVGRVVRVQHGRLRGRAGDVLRKLGNALRRHSQERGGVPAPACGTPVLRQGRQGSAALLRALPPLERISFYEGPNRISVCA